MSIEKIGRLKRGSGRGEAILHLRCGLAMGRLWTGRCAISVSGSVAMPFAIL